MADHSTLLQILFRHDGVLATTDIMRELKISQATASRLLRTMPGLVRMGQGRATRYGLQREIEFQVRWPLYHIDEKGIVDEIGCLHALQGGHQGLWYLEGAEGWPVLREGEFTVGLFEDLPWFLFDSRPQGYIGRQFAHWIARQKPFPGNPAQWSTNQIFQSFLEWGYDLPGALIVGDYALRRFEDESPCPASADPIQRAQSYLERIQETHEQNIPGSSAGGEQPKFTSSYRNEEGLRHAIVKFSPDITLPSGQRWADLHRAEHLAISMLDQHFGLPVRTRVLEAGQRTFLESDRFDRVGSKGRRAIVSLEAIDGAFLGMNGRPWPDVAEALLPLRLIEREDADRIALYWQFGTLIGNTDMHYGNLAFFLDPEKPLRVCPAYDMLPMLYAPDSNGELIDREFRVRRSLPRERDIWQQAATLAKNYWRELETYPDISGKFRKIAAANALIVEKAAELV